MNENNTGIEKEIIVSSDLIQTVIEVKKEREKGISTQADSEKLIKISPENCSEEAKNDIIDFMLKFGKVYRKDFPIEIEQLRTFELQYIKSTHRDHICHSFWVWSLGLWFYRNGFKRFIDDIHHREDLFDFIWYLTAFYHDIGYVEKHKFHGGAGAQFLLRNLNTRFSGAWTTDAIHAIVAICLHDKKDPVDAKRDPYLALLILCDEIQEWGRNIPGHEKRFEIDKIKIGMKFHEQNPLIEIILFYPRKQTEDVKKMNDFVKEKEQKYRETLTDRIKNFSIVVKCVSF